MRSLARTWLGLLLLATLCAALAATVDPRARALLRDRPAADELTLAEARGHRGPLLWIDARSADEYARGHLPEAVPLNLAEWDRQIGPLLARWQPGARVVIYCDDRACGTSRRVATRLREEYQLDDVWILHGGWAAWEKAANR